VLATLGGVAGLALLTAVGLAQRRRLRAAVPQVCGFYLTH